MDDAAEIKRLLGDSANDENAMDSGGSALHHAARGGHIAALEALLADQKVNVNLVHKDDSKNRITPLKAAMQQHRVAAVKSLLADQRINLAATQDPKPFRQKKAQERQSLYDKAKEQQEYIEGTPLLVFAAKLGSPTTYKHDAPEVAEMLGLLLADERTTVDQKLGKRAMLACLSNEACLAHLKAHSSRTSVTDDAIMHAREHPEANPGAFIAMAMP